MEEKLNVLDKFNNGKVTITTNMNGISIAYTYMNFNWDTDADYLILGCQDTINYDFYSIDFDEILDVIEISNDLIEIELSDGNVSIMLDTDYSLCFSCKEERPMFYIRAIDETNEEYDIRVCKDCLDNMVNHALSMKVGDIV